MEQRGSFVSKNEAPGLVEVAITSFRGVERGRIESRAICIVRDRVNEIQQEAPSYERDWDGRILIVFRGGFARPFTSHTSHTLPQCGL